MLSSFLVLRFSHESNHEAAANSPTPPSRANSLFPVPCFYGICPIGSSITGVRFPSFTAYAHKP